MTVEGRDARYGDAWAFSDYDSYIQALREGLDDDRIAESLRRSTGAIRSRAKFMLPERTAQEQTTANKALDSLRTLICDDPTYNWEQAVRLHHRRAGVPLWDDVKDHALQAAWHDGQSSMPTWSSFAMRPKCRSHIG